MDNKSTRILLVDDEPVTNFLHRYLLNGLGLGTEIIVRLDGKQALDFLLDECNECKGSQSGPDGYPDLILLDIEMPVMGGFDLLEELYHLGLEDFISQRVVMLTGSMNFTDFTRAKSLGVRNYLQKPLTKDRIMDVIDKINMNVRMPETFSALDNQ